ncbi:MAG: PIN domain-containing protein [Lacunisphaera sp.]
MENTTGTVHLPPQHHVEVRAKTYVLDTNVLLHDPQSIFKFEDNNLAIPVEVLEELDAIKGEQSTERGRNARRVHRILQELLPDSRSMHEGVKLENGGTLSVIINRYLVENNWSSPAMQRLRAVLSDFTKKDKPHHRVRALRAGDFSAADDPRDEGRERAAESARSRSRGRGLPQ